MPCLVSYTDESSEVKYYPNVSDLRKDIELGTKDNKVIMSYKWIKE